MTEGTAPVFVSPLRLANFNTFNPKTSLHFAETYVFRPKQLSRFGELFVVLQIDHATKTSPQVGDAIATILNHEYFRGNPTNVVQNMEDALHKTNEILSDLAARGEIHWIGKLHGVIGVFQNDSIHLSATGRGKAFLVRDGEIAEVTAGLYDSSRAASPMKTFENLASGELRESDAIILTTPGVTDYISPESLRSVLEQNDPVDAVKNIQQRVSHDSSSANASVVFRFSRKPAPLPTSGPASAPAVSAAASSIGGKQARSQLNQGRVNTSADTHTAPAEPRVTTYAASLTPTTGPSAHNARTPDATVRSTSTHPTKSTSDPATSTPAQEVGSQTRSSKRSLFKRMTGVISRKSRRARPVTEPTATEPTVQAKSHTTKLGARIKKAVIRMPAKAKVFSALAILLVLVFVISLFVFTGVRSSRADRQATIDKLNQAKQLEEDAAAAIIFKGFTQAQDLLGQAEALIAELPQNDSQIATDLETLKNNIARDYEKLSGSTRIDDPTVLASLSGNPTGIALVDGQLVAWSASGRIDLISTEDGDTATGATIGNEFGDPTVATVDEGELVVVTDDDQLVGFEEGQLSELDVTGSLSTSGVVGAETYGGRLYLLDPNEDEITRFQRTLSGYGQGSSWILDGTSVENAADLAIDGSIWVLQKDGRVLSFLQGTLEDYALGPVVDPLESPTRIVTSEDMSSLYILEPSKHRLLEFDKEKGDFIRQFVSDAFTDMRDVVVNEDGGIAYVLNGDTIYQIELNK